MGVECWNLSAPFETFPNKVAQNLSKNATSKDVLPLTSKLLPLVPYAIKPQIFRVVSLYGGKCLARWTSSERPLSKLAMFIRNSD